MKIGDLVTRDGSDVHVVRYVSEDEFSGEFECLVAPASQWCAVNDVENNLCRRYSALNSTENEGDRIGLTGCPVSVACRSRARRIRCCARGEDRPRQVAVRARDALGHGWHAITNAAATCGTIALP